MRVLLVAPAFAALCLAALIGRLAPPSEAAVHRDTVAYQVVYSFRGGKDGVSPQAGLVDDGGLLYGTTFGGGSANVGTVFAVSPSTGVEQVVLRSGAATMVSAPSPA
jgi:uncharacterized repeat protein (TIGR03803 family)